VTRRLRILRVIARMNVGGPALQVTTLERRLDPERFETRLLAGDVGDDEVDFVELRAPGLPLTRVPGLGRSPRPGADVMALARIVREIREYRPDIVHTHTAKAGVLGRLGARIARVPTTIHTFHGHLLTGYFSPAVTRAVVGTERMLARRTTAVLAVGNQVRDDLLAAGIGRPGQFHVMPPGIELDPLPPKAAARAELGLHEDAVVVAMVARLTAVKRPERFLEVVRILHRSWPSAEWVVLGGGQLLEPLRSEAERSDLPVRFLGWRPDVATLYSAADVIVLTSDNEGMPVSLIEAGLAGLPAVTTRVGSADEVVLHERTGLVVDRDARAVAAGVHRLIADPGLRDRMARAARSHTRANFSADRLVDDTERLYLRLAGDAGRDQPTRRRAHS
jgi:glycosyltransferase involved in cell wall biosynthesis